MVLCVYVDVDVDVYELHTLRVLNRPADYRPRSSRRSRRDVVGTALWVTWTPLRICGVSGGSRGGRDADLGGFVFFFGEEIYEERM